jgi:hypothetical protein
MAVLSMFLRVALLCMCSGMTRISIDNQWNGGAIKHTDINIKIKGEGVGGCDIIMTPNSTNDHDCECLWGTLNCKQI